MPLNRVESSLLFMGKLGVQQFSLLNSITFRLGSFLSDFCREAEDCSDSPGKPRIGADRKLRLRSDVAK